MTSDEATALSQMMAHGDGANTFISAAIVMALIEAKAITADAVIRHAEWIADRAPDQLAADQVRGFATIIRSVTIPKGAGRA